jgi:hypothetical protein
LDGSPELRGALVFQLITVDERRKKDLSLFTRIGVKASVLTVTADHLL